MRVLQHASRVVRDLDPEVLVHRLAPCLGEILRLELPLEEPALEIEAEDDVEAVRRLVRLDADEARLGAVHCREEGL